MCNHSEFHLLPRPLLPLAGPLFTSICAQGWPSQETPSALDLSPLPTVAQGLCMQALSEGQEILLALPHHDPLRPLEDPQPSGPSEFVCPNHPSKLNHAVALTVLQWWFDLTAVVNPTRCLATIPLQLLQTNSHRTM